MSKAGVSLWRLSPLGLCLLFSTWLTLLTVVLLMPPGYGATDVFGRSHISFVLRFFSTAVVWASENGSAWHATCFFLLALLAAAIPSKSTLYKGLGLLAVLNLYSLATELVQEIWVPGRNFEWSDLAFNAVGIFTGLSLVLVMNQYRHARTQKCGSENGSKMRKF